MARANEEDVYMIKAIIFDMDGTIIETTSHDLSAWQEVLGKYGIELSFEEYKQLLGRSSQEIIRIYMPDLSKEKSQQVEEKKHGFFSKSIRQKGITITAGLSDFIKLLKQHGYKLALATAGSRKKVDILKKYISLDEYFSVIVTASEVTKAKPDPAIFLKVAEKFSIKPEECLVIEDAPKGVEAAHNAGMKSIAITTTHTREELKESDKIIDSFDQLGVEDIKNI